FIMIEVFLLMFGEKRTELGCLEAGKWQAFKKHMKDYEKTKKYPLDSIVIWEKYLVYGMLFGISAKALAEFPVKFDPAQATAVGTYWAGMNLADGGVTGMSSISESFSDLSSALSSISTAASSSY